MTDVDPLTPFLHWGIPAPYHTSALRRPDRAYRLGIAEGLDLTDEPDLPTLRRLIGGDL